ncbi:MAG: Ig-like domain-containing protein, partial [Planctomycetaceae bacterium]|nr:Ig-like domain-containing protein [Planctomycetaceae bacterium]
GKGSFKPQTPKELLDKLNESLFKTQVVTGYFRTWPEDGRLVGSICTNDPGGLKNVISAIPDLELIKAEPLDEKLFHEHTVKGQQSLGGGASNPKAAPTIAKMEPANGAEDVDADAVKELRVTFDRDMNTGGFSWTGGGDDYPKTTGSPKWIDKRTCVLPVQLEVGKKYRLGINSMRFKNFQSAEGVPVEPVVYTFGTK